MNDSFERRKEACLGFALYDAQGNERSRVVIVGEHFVRVKARLEAGPPREIKSNVSTSVCDQARWQVAEAPVLRGEGGSEKVDQGVDLVLANAHGARDADVVDQLERPASACGTTAAAIVSLLAYRVDLGAGQPAHMSRH